MVSSTDSKLMAIILATVLLSTVTGQEAMVITVCGAVDLEVYETFFAEPWNICNKVVSKNWESCIEELGPGDLTCSVTSCQDENWCEVMYPCAETFPQPGISLLNCSTTVSKEKQFSALGLGGDKHTAKSLTEVLAQEMLPDVVQNAIKLWKGFGPVVGSVQQLLGTHGVGPRDTAKIARWILRSQPWLTSGQLADARTFGAAGTGCVGNCTVD
jgi:hypothetical protein